MKKPINRRLVFVSTFLVAVLVNISASNAAQWSADSLPVVNDQTQMRALFAPLTFFSINDDYSFNVKNPNQTYPIFSSLLVPCSQAKVVDPNYRACVESLDFRKVGGKNWIKGQLSLTQLSATPTKTIKKNAPITLGSNPFSEADYRPEGGIASIWDLQGASHTNGTKYLVRATITAPGADQISYVDGGLQRLIRVQVLPISYNSKNINITQDEYSLENFTTDFEYRLQLHLGTFIKSLSGWYFGRLQDPDFSSNAQQGLLEVTGQPARIPIGLTDLVDVAKVSSIVKNCDPNKYCGNTSMIWAKYSLFDSEERIEPSILAEFEKLGSGVKTVTTSSLWGFDSTRLGEAITVGSSSGECLQNLSGKGARVFLGVVSSNATMFQTTAPAWDPEDKSFSFSVAAPHLDENGKPNLGTYTLSIPQEQAVCRWGKDAIGAKAEVQVINSDGSSRITTSTSQLKNGLLVFNVSGFSYSNPTIKISLLNKNFGQETTSQNKVVNTNATTTSIICYKGKTTKKVIGKKPVCPAGFKTK